MILDKARGAALGLVDRLNIWLSPFHPFTRPAWPSSGQPLGDFADAAWSDIQANWLYGYNNEFFWSMRPNDGGDMAIWHGVYTATCALKGDAAALRKALLGAAVLQGFGTADRRIVRGATEPGGPMNVDPTRTYARRVVNGRVYSVLANVSESTLIGHVFGLWMAYTRGDSESSNIAAYMLMELADTVRADGNRLLDPDGTPAKFGDLRPSLTTAPIRIAALAMLQAAAAAAMGNPARMAVVEDLERDHAGAISHPETHFLWIHPWYQDIIAYMALAVLLEARPSKDAFYRRALLGLWAKTSEEGNAFYTYLLELVGIRTGKTEEASRILAEFPTVKPIGDVLGSATAEDKFKWGWSWAKGGKWLARQPVKVWARPPADFLWQRCPYALDGGDHARYNNMDFCAAYWLGKKAGAL